MKKKDLEKVCAFHEGAVKIEAAIDKANEILPYSKHILGWCTIDDWLSYAEYRIHLLPANDMYDEEGKKIDIFVASGTLSRDAMTIDRINAVIDEALTAINNYKNKNKNKNKNKYKA